MAKLGSQQGGDYDPFNAISASLESLNEPPPVAPAATQVAEPERRQPPILAKPVEVAVPVEQQIPEPSQAESSGGVPEIEARTTPRPKTVSTAAALQITKRFKTTRQEAVGLEMAAVRLGARLGVSVDFSKVTRALWEVYMRHEEDILRNVPEGISWERPANNDAVGLAALDDKLSDLINDGLLVACRRPTNNR